MKIVEKFISINGEGPRAGELAVFIRFKGCNLSCLYCDTSWANEAACPFEELSPLDILSCITDSGIKNVTLTGGEPLLQEELPALLELLGRHRDLRVEIETNGSVDIAPFTEKNRPVFTMDYKLGASGCENRMCLANMSYLSVDDTVKFVIGSTDDLDKACEIINRYGLLEKCHVYFSPVFGMIEPSSIVDCMAKKKLNGVRLQLQMHKFIWPPDQRSV